MDKTIKLIAMVIFSCLGISYGADYDLKRITTIMDAYEKQLDSIKLKYTCTYPLDEQGNREIVKGTFAQKESEGYVLLDERKQIGKTWDDNKEVEGIARSYNGEITRYLEHEKNAHDYHMAAIYRDHNPKLYKTNENPYYHFYRVNIGDNLSDILNNPNLKTKILGEESIDGFKTVKISLKEAKSRNIDYVWLLPEKNYLPIKYEITRATDGSTYWQIYWSEFKEFAGGIWAPGRMELSFGDGSSPTIITVDEMDLSPLTKEDFEFEFPAFTHVTDHLIGANYLTTMTMEQSGIEQTPLESSLSNKEKEEALNKYLESDKTDNSQEPSVIDANNKLIRTQANINKNTVLYWIIIPASIFLGIIMILVFTRRKSIKKICVLLTLLFMMASIAAAKQNNARLYDCAANSLYLFCNLTNNKITYDKCLELLPMTEKGNSFLEMNNALKKCGFKTEAKIIKSEDIIKVKSPSIVLNNPDKGTNDPGHFFTIIPHDDKITIYDYPTEIRILPADFLVSSLKQSNINEFPIIMCKAPKKVEKKRAIRQVSKSMGKSFSKVLIKN